MFQKNIPNILAEYHMHAHTRLHGFITQKTTVWIKVFSFSVTVSVLVLSCVSCCHLTHTTPSWIICFLINNSNKEFEMDSLCCLVRLNLTDLKCNVETAVQVTHFCDVQCKILVLDWKNKGASKILLVCMCRGC